MGSRKRSSLLETLQEKGYRLTPQRMIVLEAMEASDDHISADEIYRQALVKYPYMNISTVYRTLELLTELGLASETELGGCLCYHPLGKSQHHHLVCWKCGKVQVVDVSVFHQLQDHLRTRYGFGAELEHIALFGTCAACRS